MAGQYELKYSTIFSDFFTIAICLTVIYYAMEIMLRDKGTCSTCILEPGGVMSYCAHRMLVI